MWHGIQKRQPIKWGFVCGFVNLIIIIIDSLWVHKQHNLFAVEPLFTSSIWNAKWISQFSASSHVNINNFRLNIIKRIIDSQIEGCWTEKLFSVYVCFDDTSLAGVVFVKWLQLCWVARYHLNRKYFPIVRSSSYLVFSYKNRVVLEIGLVLVYGVVF